MLVDLHAKSSHSKGISLTAADVLRQADKVGLDAVAFCETLASAHCEEVLGLAGDYDADVFVGLEIPTDQGILLCFTPEVDEFYLGEEWRRVTDLVTPSADYVVDLFDEMGGAVLAARPYDLTIPHNMGDLIFNLDRIHGVEVYNPRVGQIQSDFALEAASFLGVPTVGGSDPRDSADDIGKFATFFSGTLSTQREFVDALRDAEYWAVQLGDVEMKKGRRSSGRSSSRGGRRKSSRGGRGRGRR